MSVEMLFLENIEGLFSKLKKNVFKNNYVEFDNLVISKHKAVLNTCGCGV